MATDDSDTTALVARVALAIDACPSLWFRENDGPWEVCRYGKPDEAEIVVLGEFTTYEEAADAHTKLLSEARARAAIAAMKEQTP